MPDSSMTTRAARLSPFVPSGPQFARSIEFFVAIGFDVVWRDQGPAGLRFGGAYFLRRDIDAPEWQQNQMIVFEVPALDLYWSDLEARDLACAFPGVRLRPRRVRLGTGDPPHRPGRRLLARAPGMGRRVRR